MSSAPVRANVKQTPRELLQTAIYADAVIGEILSYLSRAERYPTKLQLLAEDVSRNGFPIDAMSVRRHLINLARKGLPITVTDKRTHAVAFWTPKADLYRVVAEYVDSVKGQ